MDKKLKLSILINIILVIGFMVGVVAILVNSQPQLLVGPNIVINGNTTEKNEVEKNVVNENVIIIPDIEDDLPNIKIENYDYDVIVFGAEPEGITAAISSARNGLKVLLVEKRDGPGGLMTYGMLNTIDMNWNKNGELLSKGIFEEFYAKVEGKNSFDVKKAKKAFEELIEAEENITTMYEIKEVKVKSAGNEIKYVRIDGKDYTAKRYIDCTQDVDIAVLAGAAYTNGWEDMNEKNRSMSATLVIQMDGVDWATIQKVLIEDDDSTTGCTDDSAWGFTNITKKYVPKQPHMRLKGLNIGKQDDGSVLINSLQILNANMLDEEAKEKAYEKCTEEARYVAEFITKNVPGFEKAKLVGVAPELYVRQTRHILGEYVLTVEDMLVSTQFNDSIGVASYPIDVQTTSIYDWGYIIGSPDEYGIPLRTIIPKGYQNLLVIGRSGSYTSIAAGSARVIPTGMTLAQSAGIVTALSIEKGLNYQEIMVDYNVIQDLKLRMKLQKMYLGGEAKPVVNFKDRYYDYIIEMCEKGILSLGYQNHFDANEIVSEKDFIVLVKTYLKRSFLPDELWNTDHINLLDASDGGITPNRAKEIMYDITSYNLTDEVKKEKIESFLNITIGSGTGELSTARIYEILIEFKNYLVKL